MGEGRSPEGGFRMRDLERGGCGNEYVDYAASRAAGWMIGVEAGKRWGGEGILSVCIFPVTFFSPSFHLISSHIISPPPHPHHPNPPTNIPPTPS